MKNRDFKQGDLVLLLNPERTGGYEPVIFIRELQEHFEQKSLCEVLDPENGQIIVVNSNRVASAEDT